MVAGQGQQSGGWQEDVGSHKRSVAVSKVEPCLTPGSSCYGLLQATVPWSFLPFLIPDESRLGGSREAFQRNLYMSCQETGQSMSQARPPMLQTHGSLTNEAKCTVQVSIAILDLLGWKQVYGSCTVQRFCLTLTLCSSCAAVYSVHSCPL